MQLFSVPRRGYIWLQTFTVLLVLCKSGVFAGNATKACKLASDNISEKKVLERLEPLANNVFKANVTEGKDSYTYVFQLCGDAGGVQNAGVIQVNNNDKKKTVIGLYNTTQAIGGSDWVMLIYGGGEKYDSHCNGEKRRAIIMISCNKNIVMVKHDFHLTGIV
ncbi:cation-dependent mannose-6-phosphate receptor [Nematolebias whitei]|uniref:cation-dependent mannose-6-phosphate receptor n=1 Tax=Nematolebias whitei TaxID=451745 RepID=UPI001897FF52|nr:cation-dependent mannose-6-phosphate receptor [Nematolebias whitei]